MPSITEQVGLVISYFGTSVAVEAENGQVFPCHLRRNQDLPVVGDKVRFQLEGIGSGTILSIEQRRSLLTRGDNRGKNKPIAANIDAIVIVMAPPPIFSEYLVDRYLLAAELLQIQPILVVNKMDLLTEAAWPAVKERLAVYERMGYPVIWSTIYGQEGLQSLTMALQHKTAVLVGPSGVGKSSIIAALSRDTDIRIGDVSAKGVGKHTTTATRLYHLPQQGYLIDSPGVREFNLWSVNKKEVLQGFKEFAAFLGQCKFRDCQHLVEPGCAVQAALADGKIANARYESYQTLLKQIDDHANDKFK